MIQIEVGREYSVTEIRNICLAEEMFDIVAIIDRDPPDLPFKSDGCSGPCPQSWKMIPIHQY